MTALPQPAPQPKSEKQHEESDISRLSRDSRGSRKARKHEFEHVVGEKAKKC